MITLKKSGKPALVFTIAFSLTACGGGDGGSPSGITYNGKTSAAVITAANAGEIAANSYTNTGVGTSLSSMASLDAQDNAAPVASLPSSILITQSLGKAFNKIKPQLQTSSIIRAVHEEAETIDGPCGGSMTVTSTFDDVADTFSGNTIFNNYCENDVTTNGSINYTASFDETSINNDLTFSMLTISTADESITATGTMSIIVTVLEDDSLTISSTMELKVRDNHSEQVTWLNNFETTGAFPADFSVFSYAMKGRLYMPEHGYVDIETIYPFLFIGSNLWPSKGILKATGANSSIKLFALSETTCAVVIDENNDGTDDSYTTGTWEGLTVLSDLPI